MGQQKQEEWVRWRDLLIDQKGSGQSIGIFCRERGLREWQFYEWKKRLHPAGAEPVAAVEVVASEPSSVQRPDFEAGHLQGLLRVLEQEG